MENMIFEQYRKPEKFAVAYARYSSDRQREESIDAQLRAIRQYAEKENIKIVAIYTDEAQTAKNDDRDNFQDMIDALMRDMYSVDYVLVHKFNRFARNQFDSVIHKKRLKDKGIKVVSVTQILEDTPEGEMMERFLEAMDEYYSANLANEVRKGLRENALKAKYTGGVLPFGFMLDENNNFVPDEQNSKIVRRIFEEIAAGYTKAEICERLNNEGKRTQKNKRFTARFIYDLLRNEKYIGNYIYTIAQKEVIRLDGIIKNPIIDRDLWDKVQDINRQPVKKRYGQKKRVYHLTGKTVCGECGEVICGAGSKKTRTGDYYYYYKCNGKVKLKNGCTIPSINKEWFEPRVLKAIINAVMHDEKIAEISKSVYEQLEAARKEPEITTAQLKKELNEIADKQVRLMDLYLDGNMKKEMLDQKNDEFSRRQNEIEKELKRRKNVVDASSINENAIAEYIDGYIQRLKNHYGSNNDEFMRAVFSVFVDKVVVYKDRVVVNIKADFDSVYVGDNDTFGGLIATLAPIKTKHEFPRKSNIWAANE